MLGIIHNGIAYPVVWEILEKKGNSHSNERMDLLDRFHSTFPDAKVAYLTGDREFIRKAWLSYLLIEPTIPFRLRIRESDRIDDGRKQLRASIIFAHLQPGHTQVLSGKKLVWGRLVSVFALRLDDGELLIMITPDSCSTAFFDYGQRWGIETLFGILRERSFLVIARRRSARVRCTRGFCLEYTHFSNSERLNKLIALITLALCWAVKTGGWLHQNSPLKVKKHGRLAKSIFRYGFDYLRSIVTDLDLKQNEFLFSLKFFFLYLEKLYLLTNYSAACTYCYPENLVKL